MSHTGPRPPLLSRYCFLLQKAPDRRQLANFTLKPPSNKTPSTRQDCLGRRSSHAQTAFKAFQPHFSSNCSAAASNRMDSCMQHQQACDLDLSLDGLEATLPSVVSCRRLAACHASSGSRKVDAEAVVGGCRMSRPGSAERRWNTYISLLAPVVRAVWLMLGLSGGSTHISS